MSSAFTKEQDDDNPREDLPDRPVSPHRNLVTPEGFAQIERELSLLHTEIDKATAADDQHAQRPGEERRIDLAERGHDNVQRQPFEDDGGRDRDNFGESRCCRDDKRNALQCVAVEYGGKHPWKVHPEHEPAQRH